MDSRSTVKVSRRGCVALLIGAVAIGCSDNDQSNQPSQFAGGSPLGKTGGASSTATRLTGGHANAGGSTLGTTQLGGMGGLGGKNAIGGSNTVAGGASGVGGTAIAIGGRATTGGTSLTGTGGAAISTGGSSPIVTGGASAIATSFGGATTGGTAVSGGAASGGTSTGGTTASGGVASGGTSTGGAPASGGAADSGGSMASTVTGGATSSGGAVSTTSAASGGMPGTGGAATGGVGNTGGLSTGGTSAASTVTPPTAPGSLAVSNITDTAARVTWLDRSTNESSFEIGVCTGLASVDSNNNRKCVSGFSVIATVPADSTSYGLQALTASTSYDIYVRAQNGAGFSDAPIVTVTTTAPASKCGTCPANSTCDESSGTCLCRSGYVPDPSFQTCISLSGSCAGTGVDEIGYCVDSSTWVWCDPMHGITYMDCPSAIGTYCYRQTSTSPAGSCGCGAVDTNGTCATWGNSGPANELHYFCSWSGLLVVDNCRAQTGRSTGLCSTLVTSFGYQTDCFCSTCTPYDYNANACYSAGSSCEYDSSSNACMCY